MQSAGDEILFSGSGGAWVMRIEVDSDVGVLRLFPVCIFYELWSGIATST
jgi:hypothetical protein